MSNFEIQSWFDNIYDIDDIGDIHHFAEMAMKHGNIRLVDAVSIVWSGDSDVTDDQLKEALSKKKWATERKFKSS